MIELPIWLLMAVAWVVCGVYAYGRAFDDDSNRAFAAFIGMFGPLGLAMAFAALGPGPLRYRRKATRRDELHEASCALDAARREIGQIAESLDSLRLAVTRIRQDVGDGGFTGETVTARFAGHDQRVTHTNARIDRILAYMNVEEHREPATPETVVLRKKRAAKGDVEVTTISVAGEYAQRARVRRQ